MGIDSLERNDAVWIQVSDDVEDLEDIALDVDLHRDVNALEEIVAKVIDFLHVVDLPALSVPQYGLEPLELSHQQCYVCIGLGNQG